MPTVKTSPAKPTKIFISYARGDDPEFVRTLHDDIAARTRSEGSRPLQLFFDKHAMPSRGRSFLLELRDYIGDPDTERLILVVGPAAIKSPNVQAEWRAALQRCVAVVPLLRLGVGRYKNPRDRRLVDLDDYGSIPEEIRETRVHAIDFREKWGALPGRKYEDAFEEVWRILAVPAPLAPLAESVPDLPGNFVPRAECLSALNRLVLPDADQPTTVHGDQRFVILSGMGGVGKSTIAAAFSRACKTRRSFKHGVVWIPMGPRPVLPDDLMSVFSLAPADKGRRLGLRDLSCLIVLDNVTDPKHLDRFKDAIGESGRLLITTRDSTIATALNGQRYDVDLLTESESLKLLAEWSGCATSDLPSAALAALTECGRLPLAISIIGAMMRGKPPDRWQLVLSDLQSANLDEIRHQFPNYDHPSLLRALKVSVDALEGRPDDLDSWERKVQARRRYLDLAVFPGNTPIPETLLSRYWKPEGVGDALAVKLTDFFAERNLVRRDEHGRIILHDLQHDYLVSEERATLQALHFRFLNSIRPVEGWQHAANDGYLLAHLAQHLRLAALKDELNSLVNRSWMEKRLAASGSYRGFSDDVEAAIDESAPASAENLVETARKCLLIGSIAELATQVPSSSFGSMAAVGLVDEAIAGVSLMKDQQLRLEALSELAATLVDQGNSGSARRLIEQLLEEVDTLKSSDPQQRQLQILCCAWAARCLAQLELAGPAQKAAQRTKSLLNEKTGTNVRVKVLENLARANFHLGRKIEARRLARQVFESAQRRSAIELLKDATLLFLDLDDDANLSRAIQSIMPGIAVRKEEEAIEAAIVIAQKLALAGRTAQAAQLANSVLKATAKPRSKDRIAPMLSATAHAFALIGQKKKAEAIAKRALLMSKGQAGSVSYVLFDIGSMAMAFGQKARAAQLARRAMKAIPSGPPGETLKDLGVVAELLYQAGQHSEAQEALNEALSAAWKVERSWNARHTAGIIAEALIREGRVDDGVAQLEGLSDRYGASGTAQQRISGVLAEVNSWDAAESLALAAEDIYRGEAIRRVARAMARGGAQTRAQKLIEAIDYEETRALALCETVPLDAPDEIDKARDCAKRVASAEALRLLAERFANKGLVAAARETARQALEVAATFDPKLFIFASSVAELTGVFLTIGDKSSLGLVDSLLRSIDDGEYRSEGRLRMALALGRAGHPKQSRTIVKDELPAVEKLVGRDVPRATMLANVALVLLDAGSRKSAARIARKAVVALYETGGSSNSDYDKDLAWKRAVSVLARTGQLEQALAAGEIGIADVAEVYAQDEERGLPLLRTLLEKARLEEDPAARANSLAHVAQGLGERGSQEEALSVAVAALLTARRAGRTSVLGVVDAVTQVIASRDAGKTLAQLATAIRDIESWWPDSHARR